MEHDADILVMQPGIGDDARWQAERTGSLL